MERLQLFAQFLDMFVQGAAQLFRRCDCSLFILAGKKAGAQITELLRGRRHEKRSRPGNSRSPAQTNILSRKIDSDTTVKTVRKNVG